MTPPSNPVPARLRPWRSALYLPASNARALEKARGLDADAIIFDLEDAVAPDQKPAARALLSGALSQDYGGRARIVRINGLATDWGPEDAHTFAGAPVDALLLPKVGSPADLDRLAALVPGLPLWAMMETAAGVLNAAAIAAHPRLEAMVMGTNDLAREIGVRARPDRLGLLPALGTCVLAARACGRVILDGVYNAFHDEAGLAAECRDGRDMGFDGKTLIHPSQIATANTIFAPDEAEIALAQRQIEAFEAASAAGQGVAVVDGQIVENLHVEIARRRLAQAAAVAQRADR